MRNYGKINGGITTRKERKICRTARNAIISGHGKKPL